MSKVNIVDIINKCPRKLSLYVSILGKEVDNYKIKEDKIDIPVNELVSSLVVSSDGTLFKGGECILFPSREYKTWKHWQQVLFQEGDVITDGENVIKYTKNLLSWQNLDRFVWKEEEKSKPIFKIGQIITIKNNEGKYPRAYRLIIGINDDEYILNSYYSDSIVGERLKISKQDNFEIVFPLEPFQKILVSDNGKWRTSLFSNYDKDIDNFITVDGKRFVGMLIPYDGNEGLLGKLIDYNKYSFDGKLIN